MYCMIKLIIPVVLVSALLISCSTNNEASNPIPGQNKEEVSSWIPPETPDPLAIFEEAKEDLKNEDYELALLKLVWFHENACRYGDDYYGVRLSYALDSWYELAQVYEPAAEALESAGSVAKNHVLNQFDVFDKFHDFESINRVLNRTDDTLEFFLFLHKEDKETAEEVFSLAQPYLLETKQYALCGEYIDPEMNYFVAVEGYKSCIQLSKNPSGEFDHLAEYGRNTFINEISTLVGLLVVNNREDEAKIIADKALTELDDPDFEISLENALNGQIPAVLF